MTTSETVESPESRRLLDRLVSHFSISRSGSDSWGNVFLTKGWNLFIDMTKDQHERAMQRLGILSCDVLVSGFVHDGGVAFRSPPGVDYREITDEEAIEFEKAVRIAVCG